MLLSLLTLSTRSSMSANQAISANSKTSSQTYKSLVKLFACISAYSSANVFPLQYNKNPFSPPKGSWIKWQKDDWLDAVREPTIRILKLASFHWSSIGSWSFLIMCNLGGESRLGLDGPTDHDCQPDGW